MLLADLLGWGWQRRPRDAEPGITDPHSHLFILPANAIWQTACASPFLVIDCQNADQRLAWLRRGAGDALGRDASAEELHWRAARLLARDPGLRHGDLTLDPVRHSICRGTDPEIRLKPREFALLHALIKANGHSLSRHDLLHRVWRIDFDPGTNGVAVHIHRLRARLAEAGLDGLIITGADGRYGLQAPPKMLESTRQYSLESWQNTIHDEDSPDDRSAARNHRFSGRGHCRCPPEPRGQDERSGSGHVQCHRGCD